MLKVAVGLVHVENDSVAPLLQLDSRIELLEEPDAVGRAFGTKDDATAHRRTVLETESLLQPVVNRMRLEINAVLAQ